MLRTYVIALTLALLAGCSSDPKLEPKVAEAPMPSGAPTPAPPPVAKQDTVAPTSGSVHIEDKIVKACGNIPVAHFAFDSSRVEGDAAAALDALARCFATGPLKDAGMRLIGHADPRGEVTYNLGLGQRRAGSVADYLAAHGVAKPRITPSSRGEFDAIGTDEDGWARDRKVDVVLAE